MKLRSYYQIHHIDREPIYTLGCFCETRGAEIQSLSIRSFRPRSQAPRKPKKLKRPKVSQIRTKHLCCNAQALPGSTHSLHPSPSQGIVD